MQSERTALLYHPDPEQFFFCDILEIFAFIINFSLFVFYNIFSRREMISMGRKDTLTKEYMSQNDIFADVFNYLLYDGKPVIQPEHLVDKDSTKRK